MSRKAVLITGCSSGIGLETALVLGGRGFEVYATMRDPAGSAPLQAEAERRGVRVECLPLDVTDPQSIQRAVETAQERSGGIDGLVNNSGVNVRGFFEDLSEEEMHSVFSVNVFGSMAVTRAVLPAMRAQRRGRIVMMSSVGARLPALGSSAYCSSKFALEGFAQTLAQEVRPFGIRVSVVQPGFVNTELFGRNRRIARRAADPAGPYRDWFLRLEEMTDRLVRSPPASTADVAEAVCRALTDDRPRSTYVVGGRTRALVALKRYLPGDLFDRLWMREAARRIQKAKP